MVSFAFVCHHRRSTHVAWTKKVSENDGELHFHGSRLDQKKINVSVNNSQLHL